MCSSFWKASLLPTHSALWVVADCETQKLGQLNVSALLPTGCMLCWFQTLLSYGILMWPGGRRLHPANPANLGHFLLGQKERLCPLWTLTLTRCTDLLQLSSHCTPLQHFLFMDKGQKTFFISLSHSLFVLPFMGSVKTIIFPRFLHSWEFFLVTVVKKTWAWCKTWEKYCAHYIRVWQLKHNIEMKMVWLEDHLINLTIIL